MCPLVTNPNILDANSRILEFSPDMCFASQLQILDCRLQIPDMKNCNLVTNPESGFPSRLLLRGALLTGAVFASLEYIRASRARSDRHGVHIFKNISNPEWAARAVEISIRLRNHCALSAAYESLYAYEIKIQISEYVTWLQKSVSIYKFRIRDAETFASCI